jgi:branched-chain amino acid transport system permease protein
MLAQQLVNGLLLGVTYALVALGFTLIVGVLGLLNLALGETFMVSAFAGLLLMTVVGLPFPAAFAGAMLVGATVSAAVYVMSFRAVRKEYFAAPILSTVGVGIMLTATAARVLGSEHRAMPEAVPNLSYQLGSVRIFLPHVVVLAVAVVLTAGLYLLVNRTKLGMAIRAVAESPPTAALLGVPVERVIFVTFLLAGALAGASGVLTGLVFRTVSPFIGFDATLKGLSIMVIGGLGNVAGAILAALLIGFVEVLSVAYLSATMRDAIIFGLLIVVLLFRPQGLLGTHTHQERM